ncbi:serine hydrolase [Lewinella sp. 4G2]|uniref:serine hydrolase domain-containing protein n=1 Tax=Lewinella sp. 4G2 TaxID=1803372 RepID=UPI0007B4E338|nr:serine hydrolase [Lewinella sp. 4G2]OAV43183.1 hypothetical protein A3850_001135 [Lewinella sp. 4G2]
MLRFLAYLLVAVALSSCHVTRFATRNFANITDHKIFPYTEVETGEQTMPFPVSQREGLLDSLTITQKGVNRNLTEYLDESTSTVSFIVIQHDSIVYEEYFEGYEPQDISTVFSVSKSVTSLLTGIAVDEGAIEDINDPVTKYVPEFLEGDPLFQQLTIRHLLDMRSGLKYKESYSSPFADMAHLYYGTNQLKQLTKLKFAHPPGTYHQYQSGTTAIIGIIIERATGVPLGKYLEQKVWQPMGMEFPATWSLDDKRHRSAKSYSGLNTTARDLAKIGQLYLNGGTWHGRRIISEDWVRKSVTPDLSNDAYQFQWYGFSETIKTADGNTRYFADSTAAASALVAEPELAGAKVLASVRYPGQYYLERPGEAFFAMGILSQYIYVDPKTNVVIVRQGRKWDGGWRSLFGAISKRLGE